MTTNYTMFANVLLSAWRERVSDPFYAKTVEVYSRTPRFNLVSKLYQTIELDDTDTRSLLIPTSTATADARIIYCRVVGKAKLTIAALDTNSVTVITGIIRAYGTEVLPGIMMLSDYNITALTFTGEDDDTVIEVFYGKTEDD